MATYYYVIRYLHLAPIANVLADLLFANNFICFIPSYYVMAS